jgi:hypothetical protein
VALRNIRATLFKSLVPIYVASTQQSPVYVCTSAPYNFITLYIDKCGPKLRFNGVSCLSLSK